MVNKIEVFKGEWDFLSNFYPCRILYEDSLYMSVENAYQAAKTQFLELRGPFTNCTPGRAKRLGRGLELRTDWERVKLKIMKELLAEKFYVDQSSVGCISWLGLHLVETGDAELIEGNTWGDTYWGVCKGDGENHLGKLLMERREELKHAYKTKRIR